MNVIEQPLPRVLIHPDGHYLCGSDGSPFFWLGDTAWQLIQETTREECSYYLRTRARQGFSVIQTVVLAEFGGVKNPTALGYLPFVNEEPTRPNDDFFDRVVEIVDEAASLGLYVALVPAWGDKLTSPWGSGPRIFRGDNLQDAEGYGRYLAGKLKTRTNVVWVLGGDRPARLAGMNNEYLAKIAREAGFGPERAGRRFGPPWPPDCRRVESGFQRLSIIRRADQNLPRPFSTMRPGSR